MAASAKLHGFLTEKFHKLKKEGYPQKQRIAIALNMAREKGYNVPKPKEKK